MRALANDSKDPTFQEALDKANTALASANSDYITLFGDAWSDIRGDKTLYQIFRKNDAFTEQAQLNNNSGDGAVLRAIREKANETVNLTFNLLKQRIDKLGVTQPNVSLDEGRDLIVVELPGIDNPERARQFLQAAAQLEFWKVYRASDTNPSVYSAFVAANNKLKDLNPDYASEEAAILRIDTLYNVDSTSFELDTVLGSNLGSIQVLCLIFSIFLVLVDLIWVMPLRINEKRFLICLVLRV